MVKAIEVMLNKIESTEHQYHTITSVILELLQYHQVQHVVIEGYAFQRRSANSYKLYELGGVVKYSLAKQGINYTVMPPSQAKLRFSECGNSNKEDMYNAWLARGLPCLFEIFNVKKKPGCVPNPIQDIVDSAALVL